MIKMSVLLGTVIATTLMGSQAEAATATYAITWTKLCQEIRDPQSPYNNEPWHECMCNYLAQGVPFDIVFDEYCPAFAPKDGEAI